MRGKVVRPVGLIVLPLGKTEKKKSPDWGEVFTTLLKQANPGGLKAIRKMTIPMIEAIMANLNKQRCLEIGVPYDRETTIAEPESEHSINDAMNFCALFNGLK